VNWSDASTANPRTDTNVTADVTVTANFAINPDASYVLTLAKAGDGKGEVKSAPAGVVCGNGCAGATGTFAYATVVTLTAKPAGGSLFIGWSGACSGTGTCVVTIDGNKSVTATFAAKKQRLTVDTAGTGHGRVVSTPPGINCDKKCTANFATDSVVTLTATPDAKSLFTGWSGACSGTGACIVTMDVDKSVVATFVKKP
jgi:hypothetical protein